MRNVIPCISSQKFGPDLAMHSVRTTTGQSLFPRKPYSRRISMTGSVSNNSLSQQQVMLMLQQMASQDSLTNDLNNQDTASATSPVTPSASPLTSGSTVSSDVLALLVQS